MKNFTFILTLLLTFSISNIAFASFPVTKKAPVEKIEVVVESENTNFLKKVSKSLGLDVEWGAFIVGFLFNIWGVLLVWIFGGDVQSAWKGFGVSLLVGLVLILAATGVLAASI